MFAVFTTSKGTFVSMPVDEIARIEWEIPLCYVYTRRGEHFQVKGELRRVDSFIESINAAINMIRRKEIEEAEARGKIQKSKEGQTQIVVKRAKDKPPLKQ